MLESNGSSNRMASSISGRRLDAALAAVTKLLGVGCLADAVLGAVGLLFPPAMKGDDVMAVSLVAAAEGVLCIVPVQWAAAFRHRAMLYLAATGFTPFLILLAGTQYALQSSAPPFRLATNLMTAGIVFLLTLCPLVSTLLAVRRGKPPSTTT